MQKLSSRNFERLLFTFAIYPKSLNRGKSLVCEKSQISARAYSLNLGRLLSERRRRLKFRLARCKRADNIHARERLRGHATRGELPLSGVLSESRVFTESRACSGILLTLLICLPPKLDATSSQENPMRLWIQLRQPCIIGVIEFDCWSMWRNARDMRGLLCGLYSWVHAHWGERRGSCFSYVTSLLIVVCILSVHRHSVVALAFGKFERLEFCVCFPYSIILKETSSKS